VKCGVTDYLLATNHLSFILGRESCCHLIDVNFTSFAVNAVGMGEQYATSASSVTRVCDLEPTIMIQQSLENLSQPQHHARVLSNSDCSAWLAIRNCERSPLSSFVPAC
jgi:hypothetical protein